VSFFCLFSEGDYFLAMSVFGPDMQTKRATPARIAIRLPDTMRTILPSLWSILRSWSVLPSGL